LGEAASNGGTAKSVVKSSTKKASVKKGSVKRRRARGLPQKRSGDARP